MKKIKFVLLKNIIIPAGTILDIVPINRGGESYVECVVDMGKDSTAYFGCSLSAIEDMPEDLITILK
jgi:hypothetical protein